jgi:tetratricopeptide (TPR) repeat protein
VRGELDWIVMKCLEKDREHRYETADGLARDVERYLRDEAVHAGPPSATYRLRSFARRHRGPVLAAALVFVVLLGGMVGTTLGMARATTEARQKEQARAQAVTDRDRAEKAEEEAKHDRDKAREAEADSEAFGNFLANQVLAAPRPEGVRRGLGINVTVAQALEAAEGKIGKVFAGRPKAEARARLSLGVTWRHLGRFAKAEEHLRHAVALRERELGPDDPLTLDAANSLGVTLLEAGHTDEALLQLRQTLEREMTALGPRHAGTLSTQDSLAGAYVVAVQIEKGLKLYEETLESRKVTAGGSEPLTLTSMHNLGVAYQDAGQVDKAVELLKESMERTRAKYGEDHAYTFLSLGGLAGAYRAAGDVDRAIPMCEQALEGLRDKFGPDHHYTLTCMSNLAAIYQAAGLLDQAVRLHEEAFEQQKAQLGPDHHETLTFMSNLAAAYKSAGKLDRALELHAQSLERRKTVLGPNHLDTLRSMNHLAANHAALEHVADAVPLFEDALKRMAEKLPPGHPLIESVKRGLERARRLGQRLERYAQIRAAQGPDHADTLAVRLQLALVLRDLENLAAAEGHVRAVYEGRRQALGPGAEPTLQAEEELGNVLSKQHRYDEAECLFCDSLALRAGKAPADWRAFHLQTTLAAALLAQKRYAEAESQLVESYEGLTRHAADMPADLRTQRRTTALKRLVQACDALGKPDGAARWRKELEALKAAPAPAKAAVRP